MHILLSNDDGYEAPGIRCLASVLAKQAKVTVVAPDRNRSGASNSLTLDDPIRAHTMPDGVVRVDGTPTDCVHLACRSSHVTLGRRSPTASDCRCSAI